VPAVTVGERILVHLSGFLRFAEAYECPAEMTQDGMAAALGLSRAHVALELKRLRTSGKVEERIAHVASAKVRRKVYVPTPAGLELARRMREHARTRTVALVGPEGRREARGEEAIMALRQAGLREAEAVQRVLAADVVDVPVPEPPRPVRAASRPFFGRVEERRRLRDWLTSDARPVAVLVGVAGIGKSALLSEALREDPRPLFLRKVYAHDDAHGLLSSLGDFLQRQGRRRLKAVLSRPAYDPAEALAILREDSASVLMALDDLHASPAAEGLVGSLLEGPFRGKLLVATRRRPAWLAGRTEAILEVTLGGLDDPAARDLLLARGARLGEGEIAQVLRAARGHPLALELFSGSGLDAGAAATERYLIEAVLDGVDDAAEELLKAFAVLRRPARSPEALGATVAQLRRLVRMAILQHHEEGYLLHDLVKEFFLQRMTTGQRARAHARAAMYWEERGDVLEESHHRIDAGEIDRAASLLSAHGEAYAESARAGDLEACLRRLPADRRPRRLLAETEMFLGKFEEARAALEELAEEGPPEERVRARIDLGRIANRLGEYARAREILAAAAAEALGRPALEGEAVRALGGVERKLGDLPAAIEHLTRAAELLKDEPREEARALTDLGAALIAKGDLAGARSRLEEALPLVRRGSREDAAIRNNLGIVLSREGDLRAAAEAFERSAQLALETGEVRFASYALANAVDNLLRLDAMDAAAACAERALALAGTIGDPVALSTARANLGLVFARRGEWERAEAHLLESVALIARLDNPYSLASRYEEIARVYEAQGRRAEAAPWRSRAEDLFARLQDAGPAPRRGSG